MFTRRVAPPAQVAYFAANMLLTKVRLEWSTLSPQQRGAVSASVSQALLSSCSTASASPALPARRLCLVLAAAGARSPPAEAVQFVQQALDLGARGSVAVALLLLKAVADEADEAPRGKRAALLAAICPACQPVLQLAEHAAGSPATVADALCAALSWLRLDADAPPGGPLAGGRLLLSPAALLLVSPALHSRALACLGGPDEQLVETAADFLADVHAASNPRVEAGAEAAAMEATLRALVALAPRAGAPDGEATARAVARVATTLGERHTEALAGGAPDWLAVVSLVINTVAARRERACMAACSDLLLRINDTPAAARHPQLREPLFSAVGARCVAHATLPASWTTWADAGDAGDDCDDCDDVQRFREHTLADLLHCCDAQLGTSWLASLVTAPLHLDQGDGGGAAVQSQPQEWPHVEAALFVLRVCVLGLRGRALGDTLASQSAGDAHQQRVASNALLAAVFTRIAADGGGGGLLSSHGCVVEAACRLVGAYAMWLGKCPQGRPLVQGITAYLLRALRVPGAVPHAAEALRNVCARAGDVLTSQPAVLSSLISTAHLCIPQPTPPPQLRVTDGESPPVDECAAVVEGLARLVARLPGPDACAAALALAGPILERCSQRLARGDVSAGAVFGQACDLGLVASAIRFVETPASSEPSGQVPGAQDTPAVALMRAAWPVLSRQGESAQWRGSAPTMAALCSVYTRAFASCKAAAAPMVAPALMCVLTAFEERPQGYHLDVLTAAVEVFTHSGGASASAAPPCDVDDTLDAAMARAASVTHALVERGGAPHEVVRALCECAHRCALFAPAALLRPDTLNAVLRVSCHALAMAEREPVAQGALLLRCLISPGRQMAVFGDTWRAAKPAVDAGMQQLGRHIMAAACIGAVVGSQGGQLLCHVVYDLLKAYPGAAPDWLAAAVLDAGYPPTEAGMAPGRVEEAHKRLFLQLALQSPPLTSQRFDALFTDWARLCRREADADTLLAYQM